MKIVHLALTSLVGSPIKIVNAINQYTEHTARFVNLNTYSPVMSFEEDLVWGRDSGEEILEEIHSADIIHLHQVVALENSILNVDFKKLLKSGKRIIRHFASEPEHYRLHGLPDVENFLNEEGVVYLTNAQYHERHYPRATPVPLLTEVEKLSQISAEVEGDISISFSPSNEYSIKDRRWASKGAVETRALLGTISHRYPIRMLFEEKIPDYNTYIRHRAKAHIIIDEVVTGSFHTTSLEGLALGKPTLAFLDQRTIATLVALTGSVDLPLVNCSLPMLEEVIVEFIRQPELIREVGNYSREWMKMFYHEKKLINHYIKVYENIFESKNLRQLPSEANSKAKDFLNKRVYDIQHKVIHAI